MALVELNHYAIRLQPSAVDATAAFYTDILGLTVGYRPPFTFPGAWLYCGKTAVVHLIGRGEAGEPEGAMPTGKLDHIAFNARGIEAMRAKLKAHGVSFTERTVPAMNLQQVFVRDPNGILIELNYAADDKE
jgi:catechol 2,3-dioxygenase-like lactoylglutathione lyase family enzyme